MNMNLKSFPKFQKHEEKINKQLERLQEKIKKNEDAVAALTREYVSIFADGLDTTDVSNRLATLKRESEALQAEVDIIDNHDFKEKQLAREVYDQYMQLEKDVTAETERLWQQSEKVKDDAEAAINRINNQLEDIHVQFNEVVKNQMAPVVEHLDIAQSAKENLRLRIYGGLASFYTSVKNIQR